MCLQVTGTGTSTHLTKKENKMTDNENAKDGHETTAFEEFWQWKESQGISDEEDDWLPWWECFWAGYKTYQKGME